MPDRILGARLSGEELRAEAAARSRAGLERRRESFLVSARPILHTSVAASLAWLAATELLGHPSPFFAPVAAVITLGLSLGQRRRRAVEMAFGVALGILVADMLVFLIGTGTWQIGVVTALAMGAALLLGGGPLLVSQAATSAVLVTTIQVPDDGISLARFLDALVGGTIALAVATLVLPVDPVRVVRRTVEPVLARLALALDGVADAIERRDEEAAESAIVTARSISLAVPREALAAARDSTRLTLRQRHNRERVERQGEIVAALELAVNNVRVVARGVRRALELGDATPARLTVALRLLADAARALEDDDDEVARRSALRAAEEANAVLGETGNMSALHIVGQVRSTAVDLMRAAGVEHSEAVSGVRGSPG
ncbi:MAG: aromatic acid exporter family protein [Thermoleophilaceae bacterium]|nr:aromatic acid exporter family protein [Thermoleophilaceae bacterium]